VHVAEHGIDLRLAAAEQARRLETTAPRRCNDAGNVHAPGTQALADGARVGAAALAQVALRRAVVEAPAGRVAGAGRVGMAHQRDCAVAAQELPSRGLVGAREGGGKEASDDGDEEVAHDDEHEAPSGNESLPLQCARSGKTASRARRQPGAPL
jgi:hypothetical protein